MNHSPEFHAVLTFTAIVLAVILAGCLVVLAVAALMLRSAKAHEPTLDEMRAKAMPIALSPSSEPKDEA